jgi:hypothetical protein
MMKRIVSCALVVLTGCGSDESKGDGVPGPDAAVMSGQPGDPLGGLPTGGAAWTDLCAKHYGDMISAKLCAGTSPPAITSLADLEALLGLTVAPNPNNDPAINPNVRVTLNGESTGLGLRSVTQLNPRAFLMTPPAGNGAANAQYQVLSFARGEPLVELVANDPAARTLRFFLVRFHPACEPSCSFADLLTPTIESGWTSFDVYDDTTVKNTTLDCLACHQPGGPSSPKILRMQELANPWGHWFYPERPATLQLVRDFQAAHPNEDYAGIPYANIYNTRPFVLMQLAMNNGFATQPNAFPTLQINNELATSGSSQTWAALYQQAVAGTAIPVPYYTSPHTDPVKIQTAIAAYQQTMAGTLPRDQMPDISDTILDSALPALSIRPATGLDGRGILTHMCRMCHNGSLDQTQSRASFNIDTLDALSREEKDLAIARLQLPDTDVHHMPPVRFHTLSAGERDAAITELSK